MGAEVIMGHGYIEAVAPFTGGRIYLDFQRRGHRNIMMAATLAQGTTIIENAAAEPEIVDLANYLNAAGAQVRGAGTSLIRITGVEELKAPPSFPTASKQALSSLQQPSPAAGY